MSELLEKIASKLSGKQKAAVRAKKRRSPTNAPKPKAAPVKAPTLHDKVDALSSRIKGGAQDAASKVKKMHVAKKVGLVGAGVAGASALVAKVRSANKDQ